jgi:hypothetical protein
MNFDGTCLSTYAHFWILGLVSYVLNIWKSLVVVDGDGNVKQENKRKKKSEEKQRLS